MESEEVPKALALNRFQQTSDPCFGLGRLSKINMIIKGLKIGGSARNMRIQFAHTGTDSRRSEYAMMQEIQAKIAFISNYLEIFASDNK